MVSTNEDGEIWRCILSTVVLVEGSHAPVLRRSCHAIQVFRITHCLKGSGKKGRVKMKSKEEREIVQGGRQNEEGKGLPESHHSK